MVRREAPAYSKINTRLGGVMVRASALSLRGRRLEPLPNHTRQKVICAASLLDTYYLKKDKSTSNQP